MADERTSKVRATRELDPAKLSPSLFSLFPPVHFNCRFKDDGMAMLHRWQEIREDWSTQVFCSSPLAESLLNPSLHDWILLSPTSPERDKNAVFRPRQSP